MWLARIWRNSDFYWRGFGANLILIGVDLARKMFQVSRNNPENIQTFLQLCVWNYLSLLYFVQTTNWITCYSNYRHEKRHQANIISLSWRCYSSLPYGSERVRAAFCQLGRGRILGRTSQGLLKDYVTSFYCRIKLIM